MSEPTKREIGERWNRILTYLTEERYLLGQAYRVDQVAWEGMNDAIILGKRLQRECTKREVRGYPIQPGDTLQVAG